MRLPRIPGALTLGAVAALAACSESSVPVAPDDLDPSFAVSAERAVDVIVVLDGSFAGGSHAAHALPGV